MMDVFEEEFEIWAKQHKFVLTKDKAVCIDGRNIYSNPMTQAAWMAFNHAMDIAANCLRLVEAGYVDETIQ